MAWAWNSPAARTGNDSPRHAKCVAELVEKRLKDLTDTTPRRRLRDHAQPDAVHLHAEPPQLDLPRRGARDVPDAERKHRSLLLFLLQSESPRLP